MIVSCLAAREAQAAPDTLGNRFSAIICRFMQKLWRISGVGGAWARRGKGVAARYRSGVGLRAALGEVLAGLRSNTTKQSSKESVATRCDKDETWRGFTLELNGNERWAEIWRYSARF